MTRIVCITVLLVATAGIGVVRAEVLPLDEFSPGFLGMYRKVMEIENEIRRHTERYGIDFDLARAVCLYESGGNANLSSHAGAQGYFQVMPRTFRELKVPTNIEAGIKYLSQMIRQFGREDRAVAAYNGGPGRVGSNGGLPLETLQYVIGVGHYRTILKQHEPSIRQHAFRLRLTEVRPGDDWSTLAMRLGIPIWELRLHNPFLASRPLRTGDRIASPPESRPGLLTVVAGGVAYRMRHGDNYIKFAHTLSVDLEGLRAANGLWQIQSVPAGVVLLVPVSIDRAAVVQAALADLGAWPTSLSASAGVNLAAHSAGDGVSVDPVPVAAAATATTRANTPGVGPTTVPRPPAVVIHRVRPGDTLSHLARQYGTSVSAIQKMNVLRRTTIRVGQRLQIPRGSHSQAN